MGTFDIKLKIEINSKKLNKALRIAPAEITKQMADAFDHIGKKFMKAFWASTGVKATPRVGIINRFRYYVNSKKNLNKMNFRINTYSNVAEIHEKGGTIRAKSGSMALPMGAALTKTGHLLKKFRGKDLKDIKGLFPLRIGRTVFLVKKKRGSQGLEPFFILRNQIYIKPRLKFMDTWDSLETFRANQMNEAIEKALAKV